MDIHFNNLTTTVRTSTKKAFQTYFGTFWWKISILSQVRSLITSSASWLWSLKAEKKTKHTHYDGDWLCSTALDVHFANGSYRTSSGLVIGCSTTSYSYISTQFSRNSLKPQVITISLQQQHSTESNKPVWAVITLRGGSQRLCFTFLFFAFLSLFPCFIKILAAVRILRMRILTTGNTHNYYCDFFFFFPREKCRCIVLHLLIWRSSFSQHHGNYLRAENY